MKGLTLAEDPTPVEAHRHWLSLLIKARIKEGKYLFSESCELYEEALQTAIGLIERIEESLSYKIKAFRHFSVTTRYLANLYESLSLTDEAERLLVTHFIFLKKVVEHHEAPLAVRDQARIELYESRELLGSMYQRRGKTERAQEHRERCRDLYYTLLAS